MRKLFTFDDFMMAFASVPSYGIFYRIVDRLGLPGPVSMAASFVCGMAVDYVLNKIVYSRLIQKRSLNRIAAYAVCILFFLVTQHLSMTLTGVTMVNDLFDQLVDTAAFPLLCFMLNMVIRAWRINKVREHYRDGSQGYVFDLEQGDIDEANKENHPITGAYDEEFAVKTKTGIYVGKEHEGNRVFQGIPYAQPPTGGLRWKAPEPLGPSTRVFEAQNLGASPIQVEHEGSILKHHRQSEDCLTLNVCVSDDDSDELKPVIVLFHNVDFSFGGTADPLLSGSSFVTNHPDVVFVSFNYRLGIFGFIDFSQVEGKDAYPDAPNLGLLDQIAALRWVHENIAAFGGDPGRVTLLGLEAGAVSICLLAATDAARGLFQRAFVLNGSPSAAYDLPGPSRAVAEELLEATGARTMEDLVGLDTKTLKEAAQVLWRHSCAPTIDGVLIPQDVTRAYAEGVASGIEFVVGISCNDAHVFRSFIGSQPYEHFTSTYVEEMRPCLDEATDRAVSAYIEKQAVSTNEFEAKAMVAEQWNALCAYSAARKLADGGNKVHLMFWDEKPLIESLGSGTVDALATLLGNSEASELYGIVVDDDLSEVLQTFLKKYVSGEALELYPNEIQGVDEICWKPFPKALIIADNEVSTGRIEDRLTQIEGLFDCAMR